MLDDDIYEDFPRCHSIGLPQSVVTDTVEERKVDSFPVKGKQIRFKSFNNCQAKIIGRSTNYKSPLEDRAVIFIQLHLKIAHGRGYQYFQHSRDSG
jgi:hypothetical protein